MAVPYSNSSSSNINRYTKDTRDFTYSDLLKEKMHKTERLMDPIRTRNSGNLSYESSDLTQMVQQFTDQVP